MQIEDKNDDPNKVEKQEIVFNSMKNIPGTCDAIIGAPLGPIIAKSSLCCSSVSSVNEDPFPTFSTSSDSCECTVEQKIRIAIKQTLLKYCIVIIV